MDTQTEHSKAQSTPTDHPLYAQGMAHMQAGEWRKAIQCFETLTQEVGVSQSVQQALNEARFKTDLDQRTRIKAKHWVVPWRRILIWLAITVAAVAMIVFGAWFFNARVRPAMAQADEHRRITQLLAEGDAYLDAGRLDQAEKAYQALLHMAPDHAQAKAGLDQVLARREIVTLCEQADARAKAGDLIKARESFTDLLIRAPGTCDAERRVAEINHWLATSDLFTRAESDYKANRLAEAAEQYEQVKSADVTYQRDVVTQRLYDSYLRLGQQITQGNTAQTMPLALDYFRRALASRPRDADARNEERLATLYLDGQANYAAGRWDDAAAMLGAVYQQRPAYLQGSYRDPLYDAYIRSGDQHREAEDYYFAWEQYRKAAELNVGNSVMARGRMATVQPFLTPTVTPTLTATPTATLTPTPLVLPTPIASPTPPPPLATFRNQIIFFSDKEDQPGMWVMNPDGSNRRYLGDTKELRRQYDELVERDRWSPDGRYRVYVTQDDSRGDKRPQIYIQGKVDESGRANTWRVTDFPNVCYDPVWAPDGSKIAFVSQERGSDDIWTALPDGGGPYNATPNKWEWDKHPTWSPDSTKIVFWSNREGTQQIFIMDATGRNQRKISATTWNEYDPVWVK
jgi:outer membrane protein assembly factor BamD (BamD/ComL family)